MFSPLFLGETGTMPVLSRRHKIWERWFQTSSFSELKAICSDGVAIYTYEPGLETAIPHEEDPNALRVVFPPSLAATVPKGLVARIHLLSVLELVYGLSGKNRKGDNAGSNVIFGCIDGSGAFEFDSLKLLALPFVDSLVDVVLGKRPNDYSGMHAGRKDIEEFEQSLLFRFKGHKTRLAFREYSLEDEALPDGQAGCWAFRLSAAQRLPLTASGYEIEFDLLASAIDAGLSIEFTQTLQMPRIQRHSGANTIRMSIDKLRFIIRKLHISRGDVLSAWEDFEPKLTVKYGSRYMIDSAESDLQQQTWNEYDKALRRFCAD